MHHRHSSIKRIKTTIHGMNASYIVPISNYNCTGEMETGGENETVLFIALGVCFIFILFNIIVFSFGTFG